MLLIRALLTVKCILLLVVLMGQKVELIPLSEFFPFGSAAGDTEVICSVEVRQQGLCKSSLVSIPEFRFFATGFTGLRINSNGSISFDSQTSYLNGLTGSYKLVPYLTFFSGLNGSTWYRDASLNTTLLRQAREKIRTVYADQIDFEPNFLFIVTWYEVGGRILDPELEQSREGRDGPGNNTFQAVMVSNGRRSFVFYLYADGRIAQNTFAELPPSVAGFINGFEEIFFFHSDPESDIDITLTSNIEPPIYGAWVFRVDQPQVILENCNNEARVTISPISGNMLGGTPLFISGPCFSPTDDVMCTFEGSADEVTGVFISQNFVVCVTPSFSTRGNKVLTVAVWTSEGMTLNMLFSVYEAVSFEDLADVSFNIGSEINNPSLHLIGAGARGEEGDGEEASRLTITWEPRTLFANAFSYTVNISLYRMNLESGIWELISTLASGEENDGRFQTTIGMLEFEGSAELNPVVVEVVIASPPVFGSPPALLQGLVQNVRRWSSVFFYSDTDDLLSSCENWCQQQPEDISVLLSSVPPCPRTVGQARGPNSGLIEERGAARERNRNFFHRGTETCFRQPNFVNRNSPSGQHCCYGSDGFLVVGSPSGGSLDLVSPEISLGRHYIMDVLPNVYCCFIPFSNCERYYEKRPSDDGANYNPPPPACVYGDPHLITLDGFKYTFNGAGEYTLVETEDSSFTLQGRMEEPPSILNPATVFSAIAAKEEFSDTVQIQIALNGASLEVLVNGDTIDIIEGITRSFNNVTISNLGNDAVSATFSSGIYIEAREGNGILSTLITSFSRENYGGRTRGLMGNYNGDASDDLAPRGGGDVVSLTASTEDIHNLFGQTWIIDNAEDSIFTYRISFIFDGFHNPSFVPVFSPVFTDSALEAEANEVCMGDRFCLFDVAATGMIDIGLSTLLGGVEYELIVNMSLPVSCSPPCQNGVCVSSNFCSCSAGYQGDGCSEPIFTQCDVNPCNNGGTCRIRAGSFICSCPTGFRGILCQLGEQPPQGGSGDNGSGGDGGGVGVLCDCQREVECSLAGRYTSDGSEVYPTGRDIRCTISFSEVGDDFNAGQSSGDSSLSSFSIDPTFDPVFLSSGSYSFLRSVGVISRDEGTSVCAIQGALNSESLADLLALRQLTIVYQNENGIFDDLTITMEIFRQIIEERDFTVGGQLSDIQQCSLQHLLGTLISEPAFLPFSCRDTANGDLSTVLTFTVLCG